MWYYNSCSLWEFGRNRRKLAVMSPSCLFRRAVLHECIRGVIGTWQYGHHVVCVLTAWRCLVAILGRLQQERSWVTSPISRWKMSDEDRDVDIESDVSIFHIFAPCMLYSKSSVHGFLALICRMTTRQFLLGPHWVRYVCTGCIHVSVGWTQPLM